MPTAPPPGPNAPAPPPRRPFVDAAVVIAVAAGLHAAAPWQAPPLQSANDRSRWSTVWALVERGDFRIDAIDAHPSWTTIDKVQHEGHLYSSKPALLTVLAAGVAKAAKAAFGWSIYPHPAAVTRCVLAVLNLLPFLAALAAFAAIGRKYARTRYARLYLLAAAAFGTYLSAFSVTFNNHTVAAWSLALALFFALRITADGSRRPRDFALCGLFAGFVTTNELPAAAFGLALFGLLAWHAPKRTVFVFVPAAIVPVAAFVAATYWQTGGLKPFYSYYGTSKYVYIRDGLPSYWFEPHGLDRNLDSPAVYLLHCLVGHHGILSLSPIFLLTVAGWTRLRRADVRLRPYLALGLGTTLVILGFYLSRTENYNYGGNTAGLRWAFWLIPFWLIGLLPTLDALAGRRWFRGVAAVLLAVSAFSAWEVIGNPWRPAWLFRAMESAGWIDYRDPVPALPRRLATWFPSLPPADASPATEWIELTSPVVVGSEVLRLELVSAEPGRATVALTRREPRDEPERVTATLDRAAFESGADLSRVVTDGTPPDAVAALRLLPTDAAFRPGHVRYQRTPARELAFRAQHVTATADERRPGGVIRHRVDAWLSDDVPFGVVRLRVTQSDLRTGEHLARRDYVLTAAGRMKSPAWAAELERRYGDGG